MSKRKKGAFIIASGLFLLVNILSQVPVLSSAGDAGKPTYAAAGVPFDHSYNDLFKRDWEGLVQQEISDFFDAIVEKMTKFEKIWNFAFFSIGDRPVTINKVVTALIAFILGIIIVKKVIGIFERRVLPRTRVKPNVASSIQKVLYYMGILLVVLFALHTVNIPLTAFAFVGGALAIGVGFGAQTLINNFISGFIIMAEQPIRIGDLVEIEGTFAKIEDIGARCTHIRTSENIQILVPNSSFLEKNIINWTHADSLVRAGVTVGIVYGSPVREAVDIMLTIAREHEKVLSDPKPFVRFSDFGDNALIFNLYFWVTMVTLSDRLNIESEIRFQIDDRFREAGIVIAFPQRDVHLDAAAPLEIRLLDEGGEKMGGSKGK